jgi:SAM-dependent methyltransferase
MRPNYSNWVAKRLIFAPLGLGLAFAGLAFLFWPLFIPAVLFLLAAAYFAYARRSFAPAGGNVQAQVQRLVLEALDWKGAGRALDIGCGNGPLTIGMAQKYPSARVTGIDFWGASWEYSKGVCERNAEIEGVAERVNFRKASAAALPFEDGSFDAAVSNLCFHEVAEAKNKRAVLREALRVVRKGGRFAFQDLFLWKSLYGSPEELVAAVRSWGITKVEFIPTRDRPFIPKGLKLPFMVGTIAILCGEK